MLPQTPRLVKCPACAGLLWLDRARVLDDGKSRGWSRPPDCPVYLAPHGDDYLAAVRMGLAGDETQEQYLRVQAWWAVNDPARRHGHLTGGRDPDPPEFSPEMRENLDRLGTRLDEADGHQRLLKAEIARELGRFADARRLLDFPFDPQHRHTIRVIRDLAARGETRVCRVRGDEDLTPEERRAAEEELRERGRAARARAEAYKVDEAASKQAQRQKARELADRGEACPGCGFGYAWDGTACGHCRYGQP